MPPPETVHFIEYQCDLILVTTTHQTEADACLALSNSSDDVPFAFDDDTPLDDLTGWDDWPPVGYGP